jgi:ATP-dependent Clp protease adaptor protein ClpS
MSTQLQEEVLLEEQITDVHDLVVYNDEVNTFDHVIETLMNICEHSPEQAEQCTLIIHHKGKCSVKNGEFEFLKELRTLICQKGISAEVL